MSSPFRIPFHRISFGEEEKQALIEVASSGWWSQGPKTEEFERRFADYVGARHALFVSSGTEALFLAFQALGLKDVTFAVPSLTFTATAAEVLHSGNRIRFIDVDRETICATGTYDSPLVKVHYGGKFSTAQGTVTVEDSAHLVQREQCRDNPNLVCFSFAYSKNMTTAEGGMLATNSDEVNQWLRRARFFGIDRHGLLKNAQRPDWPYTVEFPGWKSNASEFQAALGLAQLPKLEALNARRRAIAEYYNQRFGYRWSGLHLYPIFVDDREAFLRSMQTAGIQCSVHYVPLHWMPAFQSCETTDMPNTEWLGRHLVTIPMYADLSDVDVEYVADTAARYTPMLAVAA
jgi:perosamine synthetase